MQSLDESADHCLKLENRHTGERLWIRRVQDSEGQTILKIDGSLPPKASGPPLHVHYQLREEGTVKAGTLGARVGNERIVVPAGEARPFPREWFMPGGMQGTNCWS